MKTFSMFLLGLAVLGATSGMQFAYSIVGEETLQEKEFYTSKLSFSFNYTRLPSEHENFFLRPIRKVLEEYYQRSYWGSNKLFELIAEILNEKIFKKMT